jgi:hypothetical protein
MPRVLEAQKADPGLAHELKLAVSEANVFAHKHDFAQAGALLDRVDGLLKGAVVHRFNTLSGRIKAALAAGGPDEARLQTLLGAVNGLLRNGDHEQAAKVLDELEAVLGRAGGTPQAAEPAEDLQAEFLELKSELYGAVTKAAAAHPPHKEELIRLLGLASKHEKAREFEQGLDVLEQLAEAVEAAWAASGEEEPLPEVQDVLGDGLDVWRTAQERVGAQIAALQQSLRKTGDPELVRIAEYGLHGVTGGLQVRLQAALIDYDRSPPAARAQAAGKVRGLIGEYEQWLGGDPVVQLCDKNPFGVKVKIQATLGAALTQIKKALPTQGG